MGAEVCIDAGASVTFELDPAFEHGFLIDSGSLTVAGQELGYGELGYVGPGRPGVTLQAGTEPVRLLLIGGTPLGESIVMWWNFVGRSHEEIVAFRAAWQAEITAAGLPDDAEPQFGLPANQSDAPLPAPGMPTVTLRPRINPN